MTKPWIKKSTTHNLVRADYDPQAHRNSLLLIWILATALAVLIVLGVIYVARYSAGVQTQRQLKTLQEENQRLRETLTQNTVKMQQDQAARNELERELSNSSVTIKKLQDKLTFYHQQTKNKQD